jgi:2-keto-3-deoxy-6-phosphogluconate aldolase
MTLALVLLLGWFALSVVCFAMGTGMFRPQVVRAHAGD